MRNQWNVTAGVIILIASILPTTTVSAQTTFQSVLSKKSMVNVQFERLPPIEPPLLPSERDLNVVQFAAEGVELTVPAGWQVREIANGREMRLLVYPAPSSDPPDATFDGIWLTYHALPRDTSPTAQDAAGFLTARMSSLLGNNPSVAAMKILEVQGWPAARQEFALAAIRNASRPSRGFHEVIATRWGFCEIHAEWPVSLDSPRSGEIDEMLRTFILSEPHDNAVPNIPETQAAAAALGTWKAFRSRMKLFGDGRILMIQDAALSQPLDQSTNAGDMDKYRLAGRYQAREDVLLVTWADGSKQNYRWRRQGNSLLLTDHQGQTNHLKRIYE